MCSHRGPKRTFNTASYCNVVCTSGFFIVSGRPGSKKSDAPNNNQLMIVGTGALGGVTKFSIVKNNSKHTVMNMGPSGICVDAATNMIMFSIGGLGMNSVVRKARNTDLCGKRAKSVMGTNGCMFTVRRDGNAGVVSARASGLMGYVRGDGVRNVARNTSNDM